MQRFTTVAVSSTLHDVPTARENRFLLVAESAAYRGITHVSMKGVKHQFCQLVGEHPLRSRVKTARTNRASPEMRLRFIAIKPGKPNDSRASASGLYRQVG